MLEDNDLQTNEQTLGAADVAPADALGSADAPGPTNTPNPVHPTPAAGSALVLEGGGYRGVFTAGVLDVLLEHGLTDFRSIWGTSAGALNAINFRARQIGRGLRIMLAFRDDRRMMSLFSLATTGSITGSEFLYHTVQEQLDPCDTETFNASPMRLFAVATDIAAGAPHYFEVHRMPDDVEMVRASSSLPLVSAKVNIDGRDYLDGGTTDSVAISPALGLTTPPEVADYTPAANALVVLTQHREYKKGQKLERLARGSRRYVDSPAYMEALKTRSKRYMEQRELIWQLEREGRIVVIAPPEPVRVGTNEHDGEPLLSLYLQGRRETEANLDAIAALLQ